MWNTKLPSQAWAYDSHTGCQHDVDLRGESPLLIESGRLRGHAEGHEFRTKVFNLEVADFHTYFVGESGVWVHNTNCAEVGARVLDEKSKINPDGSMEVYFTSLKDKAENVDIVVGEEIKKLVAERQAQGQLNGLELVILTVKESRPAGSDGAASQLARAWEFSTPGMIVDRFNRTAQWTLLYRQMEIVDGQLVVGETNFIKFDGRGVSDWRCTGAGGGCAKTAESRNGGKHAVRRGNR